MSWFANRQKTASTSSTASSSSSSSTTTASGASSTSPSGVFSVAAPGAAAAPVRRLTPAVMRVQKDLQDTKTKTPGYRVELPNKDDLLHLTVQMTPQDGFYAGGKFDFTMDVPQSYPHEPPKVHCHTRIFHPNIDTEGNVCLNILKADWKPVLSLQHVLFGLELLFAEPNPEDPLNRDAAELLRRDRSQFAQQVKRTMHGYYS